MPATAICWSTYEFFKYIIERRGQEALIVRRENLLVQPPSPKDLFGIVPASALSSPATTDSNTTTTTTTTPPSSPSAGQAPLETSVKPRELPAMSGAGMYGALQYNTIHHQQTSTAASATRMQMRSN